MSNRVNPIEVIEDVIAHHLNGVVVIKELSEAKEVASEIFEATKILRRLATDTDESPDWPAGWDWNRIDNALAHISRQEDDEVSSD